MQAQPELPFAGQELLERLAAEDRLYLFLDYDGTLAEFSPTPDTVFPDEELVGLLAALVKTPGVRIAMVSGRRLEHILKLVPLPGILLAGTYGLEMRTPQGDRFVREGLEDYERYLGHLEPEWQNLVASRAGFYLEDKTWSLAIHARFAEREEVEQVFHIARQRAEELGMPEGMQFLGGDRFLEISPQAASKGLAVETILAKYPSPGALPVYFGDDDKDEAAFAVIQRSGGVCVRVSPLARPTLAGYRLRTPADTRRFLADLVDLRSADGEGELKSSRAHRSG
jgi:trehalose-phosphatase